MLQDGYIKAMLPPALVIVCILVSWLAASLSRFCVFYKGFEDYIGRRPLIEARDAAANRKNSTSIDLL